MTRTMFAEVKDHLPASDVLTHFLGPARHHRYLCPFHPDKQPSLSAKNGGIVCFGCQWKGDIFRFIEDHQGVSRGEALQIAADMAGVILPERNRGKRKQKTPQLPSLVESMAQVHRETRKILGEMLKITRKCGADASRKAWDLRESEEIWDMVELGAVLDRDAAIMEMQVSHE